MRFNRGLRGLVAFFFFFSGGVQAQRAWFADGFHGGVYGHYPAQYTRFINETLLRYPAWAMNLEIEPETWDTVSVREPENFRLFAEFMQSDAGRLRAEYVNPAYGQPYFYNINGESMIRQFAMGMRKLHQHFPGMRFQTYATEEPCFTSALPQVLKSFGFRYAVLKNPNTCWGGYFRARGGQLVNWRGPDGSTLLTIPRYSVESLDDSSTWQTIASTNRPSYIQAAYDAGISQPLGMCLQDAGWKFGPWLRSQKKSPPSTYTIFTAYIDSVSGGRQWPVERYTQEDVQVSLVWGSQVLQQIARQVRDQENDLLRTEKLASRAAVLGGMTYPADSLNEAWRQVMLAQHHDCWIVPYNGRKGDTWIDKVERWTGSSREINAAVRQAAWDTRIAGKPMGPTSRTNKSTQAGTSSSAAPVQTIQVFNPAGSPSTELVRIKFPVPSGAAGLQLLDAAQKAVPLQIDSVSGELIFPATVPGMAVRSYTTKLAAAAGQPASLAAFDASGVCVINTSQYRLVLDPDKGGAITSLIAKRLGQKEFVDQRAAQPFNGMTGYFYKDSSEISTASQQASIRITRNGPLECRVEVRGLIHDNPFTQTLTLTRDGELIDVELLIDWKEKAGIGSAYKQAGGYRGEDYRKAFYDDSRKLQTRFPLNLQRQRVFRNAPFDVLESGLQSTVFQTWDSIKNNVLLNWVDVTDGNKQYGLALFTDHTTNYLHGKDIPLGLTTQYAGVGLWGRNYSVNGPTRFRYALYPHAGDWEKAAVWNKNVQWNNPMVTSLNAGESETIANTAASTKQKQANVNPHDDRSLVRLSDPGVELSAVYLEGGDLMIRLFNPGTKKKSVTASLGLPVQQAQLVELDGRLIRNVPLRATKAQPAMQPATDVSLELSPFQILTLKVKTGLIQPDLLN